MSEVKKHAKYSASSAKRWRNCHGSIRLSEKAPPQIESKYAIEGTNAHACLEELLERKLAPELTRQRYGTEKFRHALDAMQVIERPFVDCDREEPILLIEQKGTLSAIHKEFGGTVDAAVVEEFGTLYVFDYKYGAGVPVEAVENDQMISYAMAIAAKYDWNFKDVVMTIIQPRAEHPEGPVRSWRISIKELYKYVALFKKDVDACEKPDAKLNPGEWCRWCPAKTICPELTDKALKSAQADFPLPLPTNIKKLGAALKAAEKIELWIKSIREYAFHELSRGREVEGYKLVPKRAHRKWLDAGLVEDWVYDRNLQDAAMDLKLKSPAQMKKALPKKYWFDIDAKSTQVSTGLTMAKNSDERDAIDQLAVDFPELEDENQ